MNSPETSITPQQPAADTVAWYSPGESRVLQIGDASVVVRLVDRKGRRARIAVSTLPRGHREGDGET